MDHKRLETALSALVPPLLAHDLVGSFLSIRQDAATRTFGRSGPGKFVETVVQILQQLATGNYDAAPSVDDYLSKKVESTGLDDGLRICTARIARAMYTLRNKRNIAHKGVVDPNSYDLDYVHAGARWVMAELLRHAQGITMEEAGKLIELVHAPVGRLVEEIDGKRIVHGDLSLTSEILVLFHSHHPDRLNGNDVIDTLDRQKEKSVQNRINELYKQKLIEGSWIEGFRLTTPGFAKAVGIITKASK